MRPSSRSAHSFALMLAACAVFAASPIGAGVTVSQSVPARPQAEREAVARAVFDALASGDAARFEAVAQARFDAAALARRTPADRAAMVTRLREDFGAMTIDRVRAAEDEAVTFFIKGATGLQGRLEIALTAAPPFKVTSLAVEVGESDDTPSVAPPPISGNMSTSDLTAALDAYLAARAADGTFAGVVALSKDGVTVFERGYGLADRERQTPAGPTIAYNVASIGKAFTKVAIGQLVSQGKLALTDTLGKVLPDYPNPAARRATIAQLLTHQAGIANFFGPAFDAAPKTRFASNADYFAFVAPQPLRFEPGTKREYCNGCYVVLGAIVARVSGSTYEDYISRHVFAPAGMAHTGYFRADQPGRALAQGYSRQLGGTDSALRNARDAHGVAGSAAGGAYSTAADLLAFDKAVREGRLLDATMTAWFLDGDVPAPGARAGGDVGFAGGAPGTNALLETDQRWAVAVVSNLDPPTAADLGLAIKRRLSR